MSISDLKIMALATYLDLHMVDAESLLIEGHWSVNTLNFEDTANAQVLVQGHTFFIYNNEIKGV